MQTYMRYVFDVFLLASQCIQASTASGVLERFLRVFLRLALFVLAFERVSGVDRLATILCSCKESALVCSVMCAYSSI